MPIDSTLNVRSILDLVASDFSYKKKTDIAFGEPLSSFPDNSAPNESRFPISLSLSLGSAPFTQNQLNDQNGITVITLPQWQEIKTFETSSTVSAQSFLRVLVVEPTASSNTSSRSGVQTVMIGKIGLPTLTSRRMYGGRIPRRL